ncbi:6,7-dimethyl-8-ribityllumazine synthase [Ligilactobacillus sp. WILCCON 0076]|uniref:6,7-dimethyl-8-ribityllumazine synthase n=1 Tax=Ligilactobacillus ubinensis TaxID=2876789 RepID=A0A9X2FJJ3_9LACO|nr:6,7-dimethyl-8-ribityllumazine synthase [Ligilactobacillus ubinensis]MCP0886610.1 6,7-dimethyl-8-ribityllumazine synthase [Ligilactobacillus ubinensis]
MKTYGGSIVGTNKKIGIVVSDFNQLITSKLLSGTVTELQKFGVYDQDITVVHVPGAMELPRVANQLSKTNLFDGLIALGSVIKGETSHYDYVCSETARGISQVSLDSKIPVMFGVLTTDTIEQAINRSGGKGGNKGSECAQGVLQMIGFDNWIKNSLH